MSAIARARALGITEAQLGLATHVQLIRVGLSEGEIRHLTEDRTLVRVHRGVYRSHIEETARVAQDALAASMACGDGAVASHRTAAVLRGVIEVYNGPVEVTVPLDRRPRRPGIRSYRRALSVDERTSLGLVPVTTIERTLLDIAGLLDALEVEAAVDRALRNGSTIPARLCAYLPASGESRSRGIAVLRAIVEDRVGRGVPESVLESKMIALLRRFRLPDPVRQHVVERGGRTMRFDLAYPDRRLAIELDGRAPHWGRDRWQDDHRRDNAVELDGWRQLSFTWWDVTRDHVYVVMTVADALGLRPTSWRRSS